MSVCYYASRATEKFYTSIYCRSFSPKLGKQELTSIVVQIWNKQIFTLLSHIWGKGWVKIALFSYEIHKTLHWLYSHIFSPRDGKIVTRIILHDSRWHDDIISPFYRYFDAKQMLPYWIRTVALKFNIEYRLPDVAGSVKSKMAASIPEVHTCHLLL